MRTTEPKLHIIEVQTDPCFKVHLYYNQTPVNHWSGDRVSGDNIVLVDSSTRRVYDRYNFPYHAKCKR